MNSSYTVLWAKDHCDDLRKAGDEGRPLTVLFGGSHQSCPSLRGAGIDRGDVVFPVLVHKGALHLIAGAVVQEFIGLNDYLTEHLGLNRVETEGVPEYRLKELLAQRLGPLGHRVPYGCGIEVALVERSSPIRFGNVLPPEQLGAIRFCPRKGPPAGLRHVENGKLKRAVSLHGNVRRLCPDTAKLFSHLTGLELPGQPETD